MKKHIFIFAAVIALFAFFSCTKENIETQQANNSQATGEIAFKPVIKPVVNLKANLVGLFAFDGNLKDKTGNLGDAVPSGNWTAVYTDDRKGNVKSAIKFTGRYGLDIFKVPLDTNMSVSVWAKYDLSQVPTNYFVKSRYLSPDFVQENNSYWGVISTSSTSGVPSGSIDDQWHHLAATYNATELKFYVDGSYIGSSLNKNPDMPYPKGATVDYQAGYTTLVGSSAIYSTWFGSIDDLRFYTRILSDDEVKALYLQ